MKNYCIDCNKEIDKRAKRCSSCRSKHYWNTHSEKRIKNYFCQNCGKKLGSWASCEQTKLCKECYLKTLIGINNPNYKNAKPKCLDCHKEICYNNERCWNCYNIWIKNPKNHPNYIDGRSFEPYTIEFTEELKESIRKRDDYKCQNCSMTEEEHLIVNGQVLHVHHIDYNKQNCSKENLITTCKQCNIRANYNRSYWEEIYKNKIMEIIHV